MMPTPGIAVSVQVVRQTEERDFRIVVDIVFLETAIIANVDDRSNLRADGGTRK